jgi:hypothetical protein
MGLFPSAGGGGTVVFPGAYAFARGTAYSNAG